MGRFDWLLTCLLLLGCATPLTTVQLRAFLGADADGGYAYAQAGAFDGRPAKAVVATETGPSGKRRFVDAPLAPELARAALARAAAAGEAAARTAEESLGAARPPGFDPARATFLAAGGKAARWSLADWARIPAELSLRRESGELRLFAKLADDEAELAVLHFATAGTSWVSGVLLLPDGRRALALIGAASAGHRLEGLSEVEVGAGLATLLDARAVKLIEDGALTLAKFDLTQAVRLAPDDATAHYNLACAHALDDEEDAALLALGRAVELDPDRLKPLALQDPDLASLRERVEFRLMVEPRTP